MIMDTLTYLNSNPFLLYGTMAIIALIIGSFLGLLTYRLPLMLFNGWRQECITMEDEFKKTPSSSEAFNLCFPRSRCPNCQKTLAIWQLIPLLGFLLQRGQCAQCHQKISWRYPIIEGITLLVTLLVLFKFGLTLHGVVYLVFTWSLLSIAVIDLEHQIIPDELNYTLLWLGLLLSLVPTFNNPEHAILGAVGGYLFLWAVGHAYTFFRGKQGIGYGDYKLFAALGAWFGWLPLPKVLLVAAMLGLIIGGFSLVFKKESLQKPVAFGPYLAASGWILLMVSRVLL